MAHIAVATARTDLYAFYGHRSLPVVGWNPQGKAIVQKPNGTTQTASAARVYDAVGKRLSLDSVGVR